MTHKKSQPRKLQSKPKNGFEKLVETRERAKQKKALKLKSAIQASEAPTAWSTKRLVDSSDINKTLLRKRNKKSLFDLESDDENLTGNFFVKEVEELREDAHPGLLKLNSNGHKSAKDAYQDVIRNSKLYRYEKTKTKEELTDDIKMIDQKFTGIQQKLMLADPSEVKSSKFDNDADYFRMVDSFKGAQLLKPLLPERKPKEKVEANDSEGEEPAYGFDESSNRESSDEGGFNNPEIEDFEEKEVDRKLKRLNVDKAEKKLESFNRILETLKNSAAAHKEATESEEEIDFDSADDEEEEESGTFQEEEDYQANSGSESESDKSDSENETPLLIRNSNSREVEQEFLQTAKVKSSKTGNSEKFKNNSHTNKRVKI